MEIDKLNMEEEQERKAAFAKIPWCHAIHRRALPPGEGTHDTMRLYIQSKAYYLFQSKELRMGRSALSIGS